MNDIIPRKCCLKYDPPMLTIYYELKESGKLHRRSIPVRPNINNDIDESVINHLINESHHSKYLRHFKSEQIQKLLKMLNEQRKEIEVNEKTIEQQKKTGSLSLDEEILNADLNKLNDDKLNKVKEVMNLSFEENQVKPGDYNWKYDVEIDFNNGEKNSKIESGWDEDDDDESDMEF